MKKLSEEHRKKISEAHKGKKLSESHKQKVSKAHKGREITKEWREKISKAKKGKHLSENHKKKLKENNAKYWKGKKMSNEARKKMSENNGSAIPIIIHDCKTGKDTEFKSQIKGYEYLQSIGVKCTYNQYRGYLVRMAKGQEIIYPRSKDLYRYTARYKTEENFYEFL